MTTADMMDRCKERLGIDTDYKLSKITDISNARLSDYRKGMRVPDEYACFKFAEILGESPSAIIAQIQAENSKNKDRAMFFKHFLTTVGLWITMAVIPVHLDGSLSSAQAATNKLETRTSSTLQKDSLHEMQNASLDGCAVSSLCSKMSDTLRVTGT